jgi:DNA end-binding protein Ku
MRGNDTVGLGRVVLSKRERVVMLEPWDKGLIATALRYPYEVRDAKDYFEDIPDLTVEPEMLKLAEQILRSKTTEFEPSCFVDRYEQALVEMLQKKQAGIVVSREPATPQLQNVTNIMDALRRSLAQEQTISTPHKKKRKTPQRQGEMLLPIPGRKDTRATLHSATRPTGRRNKAS